MKFHMENDCLALITSEKYADLVSKAEANESATESVIPTITGAIAAGLILGSVGYACYSVVDVVRQEERRKELRSEENSLREQIAEFKRKHGAANE